MPGGVAQRRNAASDAAIAVASVASRASSRRSAALTARSLRNWSVRAEPRPDADVRPDTLLHEAVPQHALEPIPTALRDPGGSGIRRVDLQLEPLERELVQAPARHQVERAA